MSHGFKKKKRLHQFQPQGKLNINAVETELSLGDFVFWDVTLKCQDVHAKSCNLQLAALFPKPQ